MKMSVFRAGISEDPRVAGAVFVGHRTAEHPLQQIPLPVFQRLTGRNHRLERNGQPKALCVHNPSESSEYSGITVQVFGTVFIYKFNVRFCVLFCQGVGGKDDPIFQETFFCLVASLVFPGQLDGIAPKHNAPAAGGYTKPGKTSPTGCFVCLHLIFCHEKMSGLTGRPAGAVGNTHGFRNPI